MAPTPKRGCGRWPSGRVPTRSVYIVNSPLWGDVVVAAIPCGGTTVPRQPGLPVQGAIQRPRGQHGRLHTSDPVAVPTQCRCKLPFRSVRNRRKAFAYAPRNGDAHDEGRWIHQHLRLAALPHLIYVTGLMRTHGISTDATHHPAMRDRSMTPSVANHSISAITGVTSRTDRRLYLSSPEAEYLSAIRDHEMTTDLRCTHSVRGKRANNGRENTERKRELLEAVCERFHNSEGVPCRFFTIDNVYLFIGDYKNKVLLTHVDLSAQNVTFLDIRDKPTRTGGWFDRSIIGLLVSHCPEGDWIEIREIDGLEVDYADCEIFHLQNAGLIPIFALGDKFIMANPLFLRGQAILNRMARAKPEALATE